MCVWMDGSLIIGTQFFFQLNCIFAIVWDCPRWLYADRAGYWKRLNNTLFGNILPHASHVDATDAICLFSINGHITLHCMNSVYYIIYSCHRWIYIYILIVYLFLLACHSVANNHPNYSVALTESSQLAMEYYQEEINAEWKTKCCRLPCLSNIWQ